MAYESKEHYFIWLKKRNNRSILSSLVALLIFLSFTASAVVIINLSTIEHILKINLSTQQGLYDFVNVLLIPFAAGMFICISVGILLGVYAANREWLNFMDKGYRGGSNK